MDGQKKFEPPPPERWKLVKDGTLQTEDLKVWLKRMSEWAAAVRNDIIELEKHTKHPPKGGDPGPPPPPPE